MASLDLAILDRLTGGRLGVFDVACPFCGPSKSPHGAQRRVIRVWRLEPGFAGFVCARCGERGYVRDQHAPAPDPARLARARAEADERHRVHAAERLSLARWLWRRRQPITGTVAETYLRAARGIRCRLPATLAYLPPNPTKGYPPAMIAAFGLAHEVLALEVEPGILAIADDVVRGVHITRLLPDGSDRERSDQAKIMIGHSVGSPLVLAPPNDQLGLSLAEGIEDALTMHAATGLGAWAAGSASRLPALADAIPSYIESVTVLVDDDLDGRRHAETLVDRFRGCRVEVRQVVANRWRLAS